VVSGNVSFYNETEGRAIFPTPTVGMVGIIESAEDRMGLRFEREGLEIVLLGETRDELGGSEYLQLIDPDANVRPPAVDLEWERRLIEILLRARGEGLIETAHDLGSGGLAIALAESCMEGTGAEIGLDTLGELDAVSLLFGESQARALVTCTSDAIEALLNMAEDLDVPAVRIGVTKPELLRVRRGGVDLLKVTVPEMRRIWSEAFADLLAGATPEDVIGGRVETVDVIAH
jgi:phosphoribosylformylglycinamidine synthase subunit PurL